MIDSKEITEKLKSLNDKINDISSNFGEEIAEELMERIDSSLNSFLKDFKELSSKSFDFYWEKQEKIKLKTNSNKIDNELLEDDNMPKFIIEYDKNNKKK